MAKKRNGEGSLYKVETISGIRWQASITAGKDKKGNLIRISGTGKTQAEAIARRQKNLVKYLERQNALPAAYEAHRLSEVNLTVSRMLHKWLAQLDRETINDTVFRGYQHRVELHLASPPFGDIVLKKLTPAQVKEHFQKTLTQKRKNRGRGKGVEQLLGYPARNNIWVVFHMAMKWALLEGFIEKLPGVLEAKPAQSRVEQTRKQVEQFEFAETRWKPRAILMELAGREDEAQWLFQLVMACRQSEKLGLEWSSFQNLDGRDKDSAPTVMFKQQLARKQVFHDCGTRNTETGLFPCGFTQANRCPKKTGDSGYYIYESTKTVGGVRRVPIPKVLAQVLLEHKARQDEWKKSPAWASPEGLEDLVFTTVTGQPIRHQQDTKDWRKLCKELGLGDLRGHTARHFAATTLIGLGFPIEIVGQIIGHASEEITRRIYTKATEDAMAPAVQDYEDSLLKDRNDAMLRAQHDAYKRYAQMENELSEK
jgi:integrase